MPTIYCDTRQHEGKHVIKEKWWRSHGIELVQRALPFADYWADGSNVAVDTKKDVQELAMDVGKDHERFRRECEKARDAGYRLVILVERAERYCTRAALAQWVSTVCRRCRMCDPREVKGRRCRRGNKPLQGATVAEIIGDMSEKYGVRFEFVSATECPRRVCELLGIDYGEDSEGAGGA